MKERLRQLREEKGITQKEVARAIGVTSSDYANYEQGIREPSIDILINLCKFFNVSADFLIGLENLP